MTYQLWELTFYSSKKQKLSRACVVSYRLWYVDGKRPYLLWRSFIRFRSPKRFRQLRHLYDRVGTEREWKILNVTHLIRSHWSSFYFLNVLSTWKTISEREGTRFTELRVKDKTRCCVTSLWNVWHWDLLDVCTYNKNWIIPMVRTRITVVVFHMARLSRLT